MLKLWGDSTYPPKWNRLKYVLLHWTPTLIISVNLNQNCCVLYNQTRCSSLLSQSFCVTCRYIDTTISQVAILKLVILVHFTPLIENDLGGISWEILGISQEIEGNFQAVLYSYQQSLIEYSWKHNTMLYTGEYVYVVWQGEFHSKRIMINFEYAFLSTQTRCQNL